MIAAFRLLPVAGQAIVALLVIGTFTAIATKAYNKIYNRGYDAAIYAIAKKDKRAIDAADKITKQVDDCFNSNREWDDLSGVCK